MPHAAALRDYGLTETNNVKIDIPILLDRNQQLTTTLICNLLPTNRFYLKCENVIAKFKVYRLPDVVRNMALLKQINRSTGMQRCLVFADDIGI